MNLLIAQLGIVLLVFVIAMLTVKIIFDRLAEKDCAEAVAKFERLTKSLKEREDALRKLIEEETEA